MFKFISNLPRKEEPKHLCPREKLQGYYGIAKEALDRAFEAELSGRTAAAIKLYATGLDAILEGLQVKVQPSGLGPLGDSVAAWRADLQAWHGPAASRLKLLEVASPNTPPPPRSLTRVATGLVRSLSAAEAHMAVRHGGSPGTPPLRAGGAVYSPAGAVRGSPTASSPGDSSADPLEKYKQLILNELLEIPDGSSPSGGHTRTRRLVGWDDVLGLTSAKQALREAVVLPSLRPDLFQGLRAPVRGVLLYGPPGNGKTLLGRALAAEARAAFFCISASSLTSKWVGDGEKLVRALFEAAAERQPAVVFIDEADSILGARGKSGENDSSRRLLTEFLVQFDGVSGGGDRVVVVAATNRPQEIDEAVRRRLSKRIYIPLPDESGRAELLAKLLKDTKTSLSRADLVDLARATPLFSCSDLAALAREAAMQPLREIDPKRLAKVPANSLRAVSAADFTAALRVVRPSASAESLQGFEEFTRQFGAHG